MLLLLLFRALKKHETKQCLSTIFCAQPLHIYTFCEQTKSSTQHASAQYHYHFQNGTTVHSYTVCCCFSKLRTDFHATDRISQANIKKNKINVKTHWLTSNNHNNKIFSVLLWHWFYAFVQKQTLYIYLYSVDSSIRIVCTIFFSFAVFFNIICRQHNVMRFIIELPKKIRIENIDIAIRVWYTFGKRMKRCRQQPFQYKK